MKIFTKPLIMPGSLHLRNLFPRKKMIPDIVEFVSDESAGCFKHVKLKTAEKMYNTKFTPSDKDYGEYTYKTFVLNKKTGEPVEVIVRPEYINFFSEEYVILDTPKGMVTDALQYLKAKNKIIYSFVDGKPVIGRRYFGYDSITDSITSGGMSSYAKDEYLGIGFIEHQIAIERMLRDNISNIDIRSKTSAYKFHKNCGFEVIRNNIEIDENQLTEKINKCIEKSNLDENTVKKLLVCRKKSEGHYLYDENSTYENIINYMMAQNRPDSEFKYFCVDMRLSKEALEEWKMIIEKHPIFIGQKLPSKK